MTFYSHFIVQSSLLIFFTFYSRGRFWKSIKSRKCRVLYLPKILVIFFNKLAAILFTMATMNFSFTLLVKPIFIGKIAHIRDCLWKNIPRDQK